MDTISLELAHEAEDTHTIGRRSARSARVEVLTGVERRRSWTEEQKRAIVGESLGPDLTPTEVARKYRISTGQLTTWRRQLVSFQGAMVPPPCVREVAARIGSRPQGALEDEHGSVWTDV